MTPTPRRAKVEGAGIGFNVWQTEPPWRAVSHEFDLKPVANFHRRPSGEINPADVHAAPGLDEVARLGGYDEVAFLPFRRQA
jgi:hypothetical protein